MTLIRTRLTLGTLLIVAFAALWLRLRCRAALGTLLAIAALVSFVALRAFRMRRACGAFGFFFPLFFPRVLGAR